MVNAMWFHTRLPNDVEICSAKRLGYRILGAKQGAQLACVFAVGQLQVVDVASGLHALMRALEVTAVFGEIPVPLRGHWRCFPMESPLEEWAAWTVEVLRSSPIYGVKVPTHVHRDWIRCR